MVVETFQNLSFSFDNKATILIFRFMMGNPTIPLVVPNYSKWDLVRYSGGSPGLENAVKRWCQPIGPICFSVYFDASP
jgi:hypothetical protein